MKKYAFLLLSAFFIWSCEPNPSTSPDKETKKETTDQLSIQTTIDESLNHSNLTIIPVFPGESFEINEAAGQFKELGEMIQHPRFNVTEKKPFGSFEDASAVNQLSVGNKSGETVFLMGGDIVVGGNQDRMIEQDYVFETPSIDHIGAYCVEHNRWTYENKELDMDEAVAKRKKSEYAFTGYFNVAANNVRKSAIYDRNQEEVWDKVAETTSFHNAQSSTEAYSALRESEAFQSNSKSMLDFFSDKMIGKDAIGMIAISGDKVIAIDIFGHSNLFQKKYKALLHSYTTAALQYEKNTDKVNVEKAINFTKNSFEDYFVKQESTKKMFFHKGKFVHFNYVK